MHPHLGAVSPHGPALVGPWECRAAAPRADVRDTSLALRDPVARGQCPCAPKEVGERPGSNRNLENHAITLLPAARGSAGELSARDRLALSQLSYALPYRRRDLNPRPPEP